MQQPKGIAVVLGVILGLVVIGAVIAGVLLFKSESKKPIPATNTNTALQLGCSVDSDCSSYCGVDPCFQPICGVTTIGAAGSCTCRSTCGPIVPGGNTNAAANTNTNANVNVSTNVNANSSASTAGWKTYTNTKHAYSVLYPSDWRVNTQGACSLDYVGFGKDEGGVQYTCPPDGGGWTYNISAISNSTVEKFINDIKKNNVVTVSDSMISGKPAKHYQYTFTSEFLGGTFTNEGYIVANGATLFDISSEFDGTVKINDAELGTFAKTFTFTE